MSARTGRRRPGPPDEPQAEDGGGREHGGIREVGNQILQGPTQACVTCHGDMNQIAGSIQSGARKPWGGEPACADAGVASSIAASNVTPAERTG